MASTHGRHTQAHTDGRHTHKHMAGTHTQAHTDGRHTNTSTHMVGTHIRQAHTHTQQAHTQQAHTHIAGTYSHGRHMGTEAGTHVPIGTYAYAGTAVCRNSSETLSTEAPASCSVCGGDSRSVLFPDVVSQQEEGAQQRGLAAPALACRSNN